jgi:hypothetical protein
VAWTRPLLSWLCSPGVFLPPIEGEEEEEEEEEEEDDDDDDDEDEEEDEEEIFIYFIPCRVTPART